MRQTLTRVVDLKKDLQLIHKNIQDYPVYTFLNSNSQEQGKKDVYSKYDLLAGIDVIDTLKVEGNSFDALENFQSAQKDWLFGYLSYELKDEVEKLRSENADRIHFPPIHFFRPRYVLRVSENRLSLDFLPEHNSKAEAQTFLEKLFQEHPIAMENKSAISISAVVDENKYLDNIKKIKEHIQRGDIYEMNYCTEFYGTAKDINPVELYERMNALSPMPFSAFYRLNEFYALCASPERYLAKRDRKIISQPIKGTARRGKTESEDKIIAEALFNDPKEQAENVMIVDLVRNDLSRTAMKGTVKVEELFGISTFRRLHQMISTVSSELKPELHPVDAIRTSFPMGSMTGAPKIRAMELIEEFEESKRGLYSGSIGYFDPAGDFDFNVVIRSILYNKNNSVLSFMVGSAITINADPEKEYHECLLKAESMQGSFAF
ncbi:MAG: anthranilate synthase component I family protein [Bacteroidetes bacterium]|nr:MAG: anthranilate synthase component I family protein [Bacteroidota bacterium]